ncbi:haloacid dehalogenase-like hydrolase family member protein [Babesia ovis]|uniref:Haloacid dehalogenase-like hydrolase family member protein n=1 Tax=Babesia ovis TaxID=5869 RepID=A0A9W5TEN4_BABOV|nr:haloacid dehalogenase-like hydrolase family member protein [Babesia ovis]
MLCDMSMFNACSHLANDEESTQFRTTQNDAEMCTESSIQGPLISNFTPLEQPLKYFAVDMDGTFLTQDRTVFERNLDAFSSVLRAGYRMFFCTGRGHFDAMRELPEDLVKSLGFTGYPGVYYNGGAVYDKDGKLLEHALFDKVILGRIKDRLVAANHLKYTVFLTLEEWYIVTDDRSYFDEMVRVLNLAKPLLRTTIEEVMKMDIMKVMVCKYDMMTSHFKDMIDVDFIAKRAMLDMTDLTPMGITKRSGLEILLRYLEGSPADCGYIGDASNDIEAMRYAQHSFAVGNAIEDVKKAARYTVAITNEEGAFATVVNAVYGGGH